MFYLSVFGGTEIKISSSNFMSGESYYQLSSQDLNKLDLLPDGGYVFVKWYYKNDAELVELSSIVDHLRLLNPTLKIILVMGYFPHSRMDRWGDKTMPYSLASFIKVLSAIEFDHIVFRDPHSSVTKDLLEKHFVKYTCVPTDTSPIDFSHNAIFPDRGAAKRYDVSNIKMAASVSFMEKKRDFKTGKITSLSFSENNVVDKSLPYVIYDDICSFGGTFFNAIELIRAQCNSKPKVILNVSHLEHSYFIGDLFKKLESDEDVDFSVITSASFHWQREMFPDPYSVYCPDIDYLNITIINPLMLDMINYYWQQRDKIFN